MTEAQTEKLWEALSNWSSFETQTELILGLEKNIYLSEL